MRATLPWKLLALVAALTLIFGACDRGEEDSADNGDDGPKTTSAGGVESGGDLLAEIVERGAIKCGVNNTVPGFGFDEGNGEIVGFDIDFCSAFAAAILGDPAAIELTPIDADNRFIALRSGEYDVLVRNTTYTSSRDGAEGVFFAHPNFYDGQAMMVRTGEFGSIDDMDGANICVTTGTTTELNLADYFQDAGLDYKPVTFLENPQLQEAMIAGRCDAWTSDRSQLAGIRSQWPDGEGGPESLEILDEVMSKEPLTPGVLDSEVALGDAINWVVNGLILAEELGVNSGNLDDMVADPPTANIATLLGVGFDGGEPLDSDLGIAPTFMQDVLAAVGNYGEIFDRHLGPDSAIGLERGINALWTDGGIQYAMPIR